MSDVQDVASSAQDPEQVRCLSIVVCASLTPLFRCLRVPYGRFFVVFQACVIGLTVFTWVRPPGPLRPPLPMQVTLGEQAGRT